MRSSGLLLVSSAAAAAFVFGGRAQAQFSPYTVAHYPTVGVGPRSLVIGDVNGDGVPDVLTNNFTPDNLSLLTGTGSGALNAATIIGFASPNGVTNGAAAFVENNQDRKLDVLMPTYYTNGFASLSGNGAGGFTIPAGPQNSTANSITGVFAADFNGDGLSDVLCNSYSSDNIYYFAGAGSGNYSPLPVISMASPLGTSLGKLAIADFDNDGDLDFAYPTYYTSGFTVHVNSGGSFAAPLLYVAGINSVALAAGDVNLDGFADLAMADDSANNVQMYINGGTASPGTFTAGAVLAGGTTPFNLVVGDVNHDGYGDVVVCEKGPSDVAIYYSIGGGSFAGPVQVPVGSTPEMVALADLNASGDAEILTVNSGASSVSVLTNTAPILPSFVAYGSGSGGCAGRLAMNANGAPLIPNPTFAFTCTNAPPHALGLLLIADVPDSLGSDPFGLGALLHVDFFTSTLLMGLNIYSDQTGNAIGPVAIPNNPGLAGVTIFNQCIWVEPFAETCATSAYGIVSSRGLALTF